MPCERVEAAGSGRPVTEGDVRVDGPPALVVEALGVAVALDLDDAELARSVRRLLEPLMVPPRAAMEVRLRGDTLWVDGERAATFRHRDEVLTFLVHTVNRAAIEHTTRLAVHAGAVVWGGRALVIAGDQEQGKTTLTAAMLRAGCGYLTDEAASFRWDDHCVQPYPKPLSLSAASLAALGEAPGEGDPLADRHVAAGDLGGVLAGPARVGWVVFPRYDPLADPRLEPISRGEGVLSLAANTFHFDRFGHRALAHLEQVTTDARCFTLVTNRLDETVALLQAAMENG